MVLIRRSIQRGLKLVSKWLPWRGPHVLETTDTESVLKSLCHDLGFKQVLLMTDQTLVKLPKTQALIAAFEEPLRLHVIDTVTPNPTTDYVESLLADHQHQHYDALVALGGGSVIDVAKAFAARLAKPRKTLYAMRGLLKVRSKLTPIIAIPTTAGSGSEATVAAVLTDLSKGRKFAITDLSLIPTHAILDPTWLVGLPKAVAAQTGMDALTHAVEALLSRGATKQTDAYALEAMTLIHQHLQPSLKEPKPLESLTAMLKASHLAGLAFTRAYVGYVHAMSHPLSARYNTPHGLANALLLPKVLHAYGGAIHPQLIRFNAHLNLDAKEDPKRFIRWVEDLSLALELPGKLNKLQAKDFPILIRYAHQEVNPTYPVPRYFTDEEMENIYQTLI